LSAEGEGGSSLSLKNVKIKRCSSAGCRPADPALLLLAMKTSLSSSSVREFGHLLTTRGVKSVDVFLGSSVHAVCSFTIVSKVGLFVYCRHVEWNSF
jgi:hypothetical protein